MKKVVIVYDNLLHKPKLHTLTSFEDKNYKYEDIFITKSNCIYNVFIELKPDIYIIDVSFNDFKVLEEIRNLFQTKHSRKCGFIIISSSSKLRDILFKSKIPDRIFSENVATDVLEATIEELANTYSLQNRFLYFDLINKFELKPYSPTTKYFLHSLNIANSNPFLLGGHINNIYYSVSKEFNISTEAARKSIYRVIESAKCSTNNDYICSIFGNNTLNDISPSRFLEVITWKFRDDKR